MPQVAAELTVEKLPSTTSLVGQSCLWLITFVLCAVAVSGPYQSHGEMYFIKMRLLTSEFRKKLVN